MFIRRVHVRGFADLPDAELTDLDRVVHLAGPGPESTALGDGLHLAFSPFDLDTLLRLLAEWGVAADGEEEDDELEADELAMEGEGLPGELRFHLDEDAEALRELVADPEQRSLSVELELELDPPLHGKLRNLARRDPGVLEALAEGSLLNLRTSALFTRSFDVVALHVHPMRFGGLEVPVEGREAPPWMAALFEELAGRFARVGERWPSLDLVRDAAGSRLQHGRYRDWQASFPADLGLVRVASDGRGRAVLMADDRAARRHGAALARRARVAAAAHVVGADILWLEGEEDWPDGLVEGESSPLEQVFRVQSEGVRARAREPEEQRPPTPFQARQ